jgi:hypothetical protein
VSVFVSRTWQKKQGLIAGGIVATVHMLFLLYLHFAYHQNDTGKTMFCIPSLSVTAQMVVNF